MPTDVSHADQVEEAASAIERELGPIDVWINNAVVTVLSPFEQVPPEEFRRVTDVVYLGTVHGTRAALARMRPRNRGGDRRARAPTQPSSSLQRMRRVT